MSDDDDFVRITLRLPADLHASLNEQAAKKRSMNAEIISRLEQSLIQNDKGSENLLSQLYVSSMFMMAYAVIENLIFFHEMKLEDYPTHIQDLINAVRNGRNSLAHGRSTAYTRNSAPDTAGQKVEELLKRLSFLGIDEKSSFADDANPNNRTTHKLENAPDETSSSPRLRDSKRKASGE